MEAFEVGGVEQKMEVSKHGKHMRHAMDLRGSSMRGVVSSKGSLMVVKREKGLTNALHVQPGNMDWTVRIG